MRPVLEGLGLLASLLLDLERGAEEGGERHHQQLAPQGWQRYGQAHSCRQQRKQAASPND
eukprot:10165569-Alexandrium_andersonii.AAC.1